MSGNSITPNCDPNHVEAVVWNLERLAVHDPSFDRQSLLAGARRKKLKHDGRLVGRQHLCSKARRRDAECAAARGNIKEPHA